MKYRLHLSFLLAIILTAWYAIPSSGQSNPSAHHLRPDCRTAGHSPYRGTPNFGKSIAVFGGSLSVNDESDAAKQMWADLLDAEITTYGAGGAGFSLEQGYSIQHQVDTAGLHDIYILWASTNDFTNCRDVGTWKDYTAYDGYDESRLSSQCGGINYCIRKYWKRTRRQPSSFSRHCAFSARNPDIIHSPNRRTAPVSLSRTT